MEHYTRIAEAFVCAVHARHIHASNYARKAGSSRRCAFNDFRGGAIEPNSKLHRFAPMRPASMSFGVMIQLTDYATTQALLPSETISPVGMTFQLTCRDNMGSCVPIRLVSYCFIEARSSFCNEYRCNTSDDEPHSMPRGDNPCHTAYRPCCFVI